MTVIPPAWRDQLTDKYLVEVLTAVLAVGATAFGVVVIVTAHELAHVGSFRQAFAWAPPHAWGLTMVVLGVLMIGLLVHSRLAASVPDDDIDYRAYADLKERLERTERDRDAWMRRALGIDEDTHPT